MVQAARRTLLAQSADKHASDSHRLETPHSVDPHDHHVSSEGEQTVCLETGHPNREQMVDSSHKVKRRHKHITKLPAAGQLEHAQRQQAGAQYLLFRRLYSDLEREQARQRSQLLAYRQQVQQLKREKEGGRRLAEEEMNTPDSISMLSIEESEEQERAAEWAELVVLEEKRHQLQRAREGERYVAALRGRLKERLAQHHRSLPPLCSCGTTIWDTNPETCANNCVFYRNPKGVCQDSCMLLCVCCCVHAITINFIYSPNHCSICKGTIPVTALFGTLTLDVQHWFHFHPVHSSELEFK